MEQRLTFQARWILPISGPPIADGFVTMNGREVLEISSSPPVGQTVQSLGDRIVLPRFVNAHTHLEFSSLESPFVADGGFPSWVREVIKWRQQRDARVLPGVPPGVLPEESSLHVAAIAAGVAESLSQGVGLIGEIATSPWPISGYRNTLPTVIFLEQLGVLPWQASDRLSAVASRLGELRNLVGEAGVQVGLSPHAPYSLSQSLFEGMIELGCREQVALAMHLAETREEVEWLAGSANGFSLLQERLGVPNQQQWRPALDWLIEQLALAPRALVVHGNYLSRQHWQQLARNRQRLSVVYCPRTHHYFGHPRYPLVEMLAEGVRVAIGTDSRASNPNLDVLEELRLIRRLFPELKPAEILRLATVNGAEALGQADRLGQIAVGMSPLLLSVKCPLEREVDPAAWLLDSDAKVEPLSPFPLN